LFSWTALSALPAYWLAIIWIFYLRNRPIEPLVSWTAPSVWRLFPLKF
jgi:hypothetical protein